MLISQNDIRTYLSSLGDVFVQIANPDDGSPEIAWGDTFVYRRSNDGTVAKMPFATIVTKDYDGFDCESQLNRGGLFRLNIETGRERFEEVFGFQPAECEKNRAMFDSAAIDKFFPHPVYGKSGWACIINPSEESRRLVESLLSNAFGLSVQREKQRMINE